MAPRKTTTTSRTTTRRTRTAAKPAPASSKQIPPVKEPEYVDFRPFRSPNEAFETYQKERDFQRYQAQVIHQTFEESGASPRGQEGAPFSGFTHMKLFLSSMDTPPELSGTYDATAPEFRNYGEVPSFNPNVFITETGVTNKTPATDPEIVLSWLMYDRAESYSGRLAHTVLSDTLSAYMRNFADAGAHCGIGPVLSVVTGLITQIRASDRYFNKKGSGLSGLQSWIVSDNRITQILSDLQAYRKFSPLNSDDLNVESRFLLFQMAVHLAALVQKVRTVKWQISGTVDTSLVGYLYDLSRDARILCNAFMAASNSIVAAGENVGLIKTVRLAYAGLLKEIEFRHPGAFSGGSGNAAAVLLDIETNATFSVNYVQNEQAFWDEQIFSMV